MRKQFVKTVEDILDKDKKLIVLLGDIGVFGFRNSFAKYPERIYNIGILEQSTIGMAAGLAMHDFIPVVHTIAPFIVERSFEQIKNDFGYQQLGGNFVSVGNSYDYAALGCTHHCPADVGILKNIPEIEIILPGTAEEFDKLFRQAYNNNHPTYFRLSERSNKESFDVKFGKANVIKKGKKATVVVVGPMLQRVVDACATLDVTILYYTTLNPFDTLTLKKNLAGDKIIICEPYYSGALAYDILKALEGKSIKTFFIGMPHEFVRKYGTVDDIDEYLSLTTSHINKKIKKII